MSNQPFTSRSHSVSPEPSRSVSFPPPAPRGSSNPSDAGSGISSVGEYGSRGVSFMTENIHSSSVLYVRQTNQICGGVVGTSGKFCVRSSRCSVSSHKKSKFNGLIAGLYAKVNNNEVMMDPIVPLSKITPLLVDQVLEYQFENTLDVVRTLRVVLELHEVMNSRVDEFQQVLDRLSTFKRSIALRTPARQRREEDLISGLDDIGKSFKRVVKSEYPISETSDVKDPTLSPDSLMELKGAALMGEGFTDTPRSDFARKVSQMFDVLTRGLIEEQSNVNVLSDQVQDLNVRVGVRDERVSTLAPTLWVAIQQMMDDSSELTQRLEPIRDYPPLGDLTLMIRDQVIESLKEEGWSKPTSSKSSSPSINTNAYVTHEELENYEKRKDSFWAKRREDLEADIEVIKGPDFDPLDQYTSIHDLSKAFADLQVNMAEISKKLNKFEGSPNTYPTDYSVPNRRSFSVNVGRYTFHSMGDFGAYIESILPSTLPFGPFICIYSFLERVKSYRDVASDNELKDMEVRKKLNLTADEALVIEGFKHPLPRVFHNGSTSATNTNWLPGIPSKDKWEDSQSLSGAKITIKDNIEVIRDRLEAIIDERLNHHQAAHSLALQLLSDTISFLTALSKYISETFDKLQRAGFGEDKSWILVSKLVHRIFATDCTLRRGMVREMMDVTDRHVLSRGVLWATFATHQVMKEYLRYGIENHPSISSEYVRFLVANAGLNTIDTLATDVKKIQSDLKTITKSVASVEKAATTASNKADQALNSAKNKK